MGEANANYLIFKIMKAETFLERISNKPEKKFSNLDAQTLLLYDIKLALEAQTELLKKIAEETDSSGEPGNDSLKWWQRILK